MSKQQNTEEVNLLKNNRSRSYEEQSLYERHNDSLMILFWLVLVIIQWNCLSETLDIIELKDQNSTHLQVGIIGEIIINLIFTFDFFFFKKENYKSLQLYSGLYLGIDFLAGPVALIGDIISLIFYRRLNIYSTIFRSLKALSTIQARRVFSKIAQILPRVKDMFLCLFCVFYLFTYIATYMYGDLFRKQYYFNSIGFSFFTMLQIMTLDGWGEVGRDVLRKQSTLSAFFLVIFVFIMGYFFWNILIGFILEILRSLDQEQDNGKQSPNNILSEIKQQEDGINQSISLEQNKLSQPNEVGMNSSNKVDLIGKENQNQKNLNLQKKAKTSSDENSENQDDSDQEKLARLIQNENQSFFEHLCFGSLYNKIVMGLYFLVLLNTFFNEDLQNIDGLFSETVHTTTSFIYTLHTILLYTQDSYSFQIERKHTWMMFFHIISGPVALIFDIISLSLSGNIGFGGILKLFKVFTVTRETIMGAVMIFPTLLPAFLGIISIIFLLALWALNYLKQVENYWTDFVTSVYTFVQILTLDDWAARLIKDLFKQERYLVPIVFVGFIFVANYFFLNMMIAFSCETFKKITNEDYVYRNQRKQLDFYEQEDKAVQGSAYHSLQELYSDLEVIKGSHLNKQAYHHIIDNGPEKEIDQNEKQIYQLLLEAKYGSVNLNSNITFKLNGKTVNLRQKDLSHLKFSLCSPNFEASDSGEENNSKV
ncbi:cation channel family transporter (macronuclear) [Tetrahymena thermophila SB210]|uniref:Cation channel family transporter n=1 Tax=Tetrahymena thermophila (strain SB210) TaxID=312017 RepID=Q248I2_TETTS|nr:cation channel family transporter [Tetrahymena thermophila SB210]EAS04063.1 cation channel family transporter [Tetrahymena thermophila SB210]|eukprot:XP_001024308.1 cation channel family transporter [Tetrahymena thermophila SB210]